MTQISNVPTLYYRPEIDGLRALAVISVLLYHGKFFFFGRNWFEGGFLGVDIFFVISGYLITRIILLEIENKGSFGFLNFYERRARRILPMLFLVIFVSIPFAWRSLLPSDFVEYAKSILSSIFFGSNFFFYLNTTEYGADDALLKPFLHTWSLGVEEQFYIAFPIFALVAYTLLRRHFLTILVGLSLMSVLFAELMAFRNPELNFFLPISRFWELAIGSILAFRESHSKREADGAVTRLLPILGLSMIAYSILMFDATTPHPGLQTIIPILGVALIIEFASRDQLLGKILASRPVVWIGLLSYSVYLWHYPIFAFARSSTASEPTNSDKFAWIALTFVLSIASYFAVERPFRNRKLVRTPVLWVVLGLFVASTTSFMFYAVYSDGFWGRYSTMQQKLIAGLNEAEFRALKHPMGYQGRTLTDDKPAEACYSRDPDDACRDGNEKIVFLGDSYVGHYERAIIDATRDFELGFVSLVYSQCPFVAEDLWFGNRPECPLVNEKRREIIGAFKDRKIFVVSANYSLFATPKMRTDNPLADGKNQLKKGTVVSQELAWDSYFQNIRWLLGQGHKVVLVRTSPTSVLDGSMWLGSNLNYLEKMDFPAIYNSSTPTDLKMQDDIRFPKFDAFDVLVLDPSDVLCDASTNKCFDVKPDEGPFYNNKSHLSYAAASLVAKQMRENILKLGWNNF